METLRSPVVVASLSWCKSVSSRSASSLASLKLRSWQQQQQHVSFSNLVVGRKSKRSLLSIKCDAVTTTSIGASEIDASYMRMCVELAQEATGNTSPNPIVGCVIVKDGRIVGRGFHPKAGQPHAEVAYLQLPFVHSRTPLLHITIRDHSDALTAEISIFFESYLTLLYVSLFLSVLIHWGLYFRGLCKWVNARKELAANGVSVCAGVRLERSRGLSTGCNSVCESGAVQSPWSDPTLQSSIRESQAEACRCWRCGSKPSSCRCFGCYKFIVYEMKIRLLFWN